MSTCFICEKPLDEETLFTCKERGVKKLLAASIKRQEKHHELLLTGITCISLHRKCCKKYSDEREIAVYLRRRQSQQSASSLPRPSTSQSPEITRCDLKNCCFICSETIPIDYDAENRKKPIHLRKGICTVKRLSVIRKTLLAQLQQRDDARITKVIDRIFGITDAQAAGARFHTACMSLISKPEPKGEKRKREGIDEIVDSLYAFMCDSGECQFELSELVKQVEGENPPHHRTIRKHLEQKYGENICFFDRVGRDSIACLKNDGYEVLASNWYTEKKSDPEEERLRIVKEAAAIILEDIRSKYYNTETYPPPDDFMKDVDSVIPHSLRVLLNEIIIKSKPSSSENRRKKCTSIAHAVLAAVRPRSFFSQLQIGVGSLLYKKFGSKHLIDVLSALGLCSSYKQVVHFEASCIKHEQPQLTLNAFSQFIFGNADFNVNTLDGNNTFHAMGGIHCITPYTAVDQDMPIPRLPEQISAMEMGAFGEIPLIPYEKPSSSCLQSLVAANVDLLRPVSRQILPTIGDFMWLYAKWSLADKITGWNGFMEEATADQNFAKSKVLCLPFIDAPPSDDDTIYSALLFAVETSKSTNQETCIVTFDLPLFLKAHDIVHKANRDSPVKKIIVRLGGFHLLMSFLGSIGYIMAGSGLSEVFQTIYATNRIQKIMTGHAYSRAVRAHMLTHLALTKKIMDDMEFTEAERNDLDLLLADPERSVIFKAADNITIQAAVAKFGEELRRIENRGPTAKLWIQYYRLVTLMKRFIEAERSGNWELHLNTIQQMLPFFHASGNFHYAKAAHIYLQNMIDLKHQMPDDEFQKYTTQGYFTIRRSSKYWSGIMSDMTIEQTLMRSMKTSVGLTQGRGITPSTINKRTMGMGSMQNIAEQVASFCGVFSETSEQHVDARRSQMTRDNADIGILYNWLTEHPPFPESTELQSLGTGLVGDPGINCYRSEEIGVQLLSRMIGKDLKSYKFTKSERVFPLATISSSIKIDSVAVPIDPLLLFHRMCITKGTPEEIKKHLAYELAPYPLSLFTEAGMRYGTKSALYKCFSPLPTEIILGSKQMVVVDGEFLLHRVAWKRNVTFSEVCTKYVRYVQNHFGVNAAVIFDYSPEDTFRTKSSERRRRSKTSSLADVIITETMIPSVNQETFLANRKNKMRFVKMLKSKLEQSGIDVQQATEDADVQIVQTAIRMSTEYDSVIIVGENVDLLVLLTGLAKNHANVYFRKVGRGSTPDTLYSSNCLDSQFDDSVRDNIMFLHAFSGCDTTATIYQKDKSKIFSTLKNNSALLKGVELFMEENVDRNMIAKVGERFLIAIYGGDKSENSINSLRYKCFEKLANSSKTNLSLLPPTQDAAKYHSLRAYLQVQTWLGYYHDPEEWGWKQTKNGLQPIRSTKTPAPSSLLEIVSCKCTNNCGPSCGCRKAGLKCSVICKNCCGQSCDNTPDITDDNETDDDENSNDSSAVGTACSDEVHVSRDGYLPSASKQIKMTL